VRAVLDTSSAMRTVRPAAPIADEHPAGRINRSMSSNGLHHSFGRPTQRAEVARPVGEKATASRPATSYPHLPRWRGHAQAKSRSRVNRCEAGARLPHCVDVAQNPNPGMWRGASQNVAPFQVFSRPVADASVVARQIPATSPSGVGYIRRRFVTYFR
jgi:hypothetical protein